MKVITFCSFKGGTAKTSSSLNIGCCLSTAFNQKLLFIDADPQANLTSGLGIKPRNGFLLNDLLNGVADIHDVVNRTKMKNIDIISSSMLLDDMIVREDLNLRPDVLRRNLSVFRDVYDICIIDTPPNFGFVTKAAFEASDQLVICSSLDPLSILGISKLKEFLHKIINPNPKILGILLSFWEKRNSTNQTYIDIIESIFPNKIFRNKIRRDVYISRSFLKEKPVFLAYPKSRGTADFTLLSKEIYEKLKTLEPCEV